MKKILLSLFLFVAIISKATTYYVSTNGNDTKGNGSTGTPWASLFKASTVVTTSGDLIHVNAGTYIETHVCSLAVGISIEGEGVTTIIKGRSSETGGQVMVNATFSLISETAGTNGNQSISNLVLDGDGLTGSRAISVKNRSKVLVHDCTIKDFFLGGVLFTSKGIYLVTVPAVYETGNSIYNCTITNCGDTPSTWNGDGLILLSCQSDMTIHDNILEARGRGLGHNGNIINAGGRHFKNFRYYNNTSYKADYDNDWNFHLEFWQIEGSFEIDHNRFYGGENPIDIGGPAATGVTIHDNYFQPITGNGTKGGTKHSRIAIAFESFNTDNVTVYNNHFKNWYAAVSIGDEPNTVCSMSDITIHNNLMENVGHDEVVHYRPGTIILQVEKAGNTLTNVYIFNNTMVTDDIIRISAINVLVGSVSGNTPVAGGTMTNINIKNNIMVNYKNHGPFQITNNGVINGLHIENNLSYNSSNFNILPYTWPYQNGTIANYTYTNNIPSSNTTQQLPLFVSSTDFSLQTSSPGRNTGQNVGLTTDIVGRAIPQEGLSDIGAYQH